MKTSFTLIEHSFLYGKKGLTEPKEDEEQNIALPIKQFEEIKSFVLNNGDEQENSVVQFLVPEYKKGKGEILKAKNYVGVLQTKSGTTIEILPKIHGLDSNVKETKKIFFKMLRTLKDSPFKVSSFAHLGLSKMPLLDLFINMFLTELDSLVKQGLRKAYIPVSENVFTLKGKINFNQNISQNLVHKERFFVEHDEYSANRPENKLIKATLLYLQKKAQFNSTQQRIRKLIFKLYDIESSKNIDDDITKCKSNRLTKSYENILMWCRVFLRRKTFTNYKGDDLAFALLFPMERIFEDYIAHWLIKRNISIRTQRIIGELLVGSGKTKMKPDIVFDNGSIIADTKWKVLKNNKISQADLYQMYAYATKRDKSNFEKSEKIILIYPKSESFTEKDTYKFNKDTSLEVFPFNLSNCEDNANLLEKLRWNRNAQ